MIREQERKELPPPMLPLLAAQAGELTVHLRPGGTVRGQTQKPTVLIRGTATFADDKAATAGGTAARDLLKMAEGLVEIIRVEWKKDLGDLATPLADFAQTMLKSAKVDADGRSVTATASADITPVMSDFLATGLKRMDEASGRTRSLNNLKQIGLGWHNFEGVNQHFPGNVYSKDGKPLLSWRVQILPYLDHEKLYAEFKLDEPWDSEHNRKLIPRMPKVYALPGAKGEPGRTYYQGFVGKKAATPRPALVEGDGRRRLAAFTDGLSNSLLAAEAAEAVEWTKPADLAFDPKGKLPKLGGHHRGGFSAVLCDGSVRFFAASVSDEVLRAIITADGGEAVPLP